MSRTSLIVVVAASLCLTGCTTVAHWMFPCDPGVPCPSSGLRETPDAAVDFLVQSFRNRRVADIYTSLHPEFRAENGNFSQEEFGLAYEKFEKDFSADAENLAVATRSEPKYDGNTASIELVNAAAGAEFPITFKDEPQIRIVTSNRFVPMIEGPVDFAALVHLENGRLALPADFDLTKIENVQKESVAPITSKDVLRVEITHDWRVWRIDPARAKNIHFLDKLKEYTAQ